MTARRPRLFTALTVIGLILGGAGALSAGGTLLALTAPRDPFVRASRDAAERQPQALVDKLGGREPFGRLMEREAEAIYDRRNVALPLAATNALLSTLLFFGCARALRGEQWGLEAFRLASLGSLPYGALACAFALVQARDLAEIAQGIPGELGQFAQSALGLQTLFALLKAVLETIYFAVCLATLRPRAPERAGR